MRRRSLFALGLGAALACVAPEARAGSYLDRAALLVAGAKQDARSLRLRLTDKELAQVVLAVSAARLDAATKMQVPAAVAKAHPHLLLALGHVEKAARTALDGNFKQSVEHLAAVAREESLLRAALKEAGHPLPDAAS